MSTVGLPWLNQYENSFVDGQSTDRVNVGWTLREAFYTGFRTAKLWYIEKLDEIGTELSNLKESSYDKEQALQTDLHEYGNILAKHQARIETLSDALGIPYVYETGQGPTEMVFCTAQREIDGRACLLPMGHGDTGHVYARHVGGECVPTISPEHGTYGPENDLSWVVTMLPDKYLRLTAGSVAALVRRVAELLEENRRLKMLPNWEGMAAHIRENGGAYYVEGIVMTRNRDDSENTE